MDRKSSVEGLALIGAVALLYIYYQKVVSSVQSEKLNSKRKSVLGKLEQVSSVHGNSVTILYGTTTGTSKKFATTFAHHLSKKCSELNVKIVDMKDYSDDQLDKEQFIFFILSTWEGGQAPASCSFLASSINDMANDFRVDKSMLSKVKYAVFGLGSAVYKERYGKAVSQHTYCCTMALFDWLYCSIFVFRPNNLMWTWRSWELNGCIRSHLETTRRVWRVCFIAGTLPW
ncbi:hypothetical protein EON65_28270 [archaeon]|nr:MAG: hypothetical protein EON65_28270 [archaeon]